MSYHKNNSINKHSGCGCGDTHECKSILDIASPIEGQTLKYSETFKAFINVMTEEATQVNADWNSTSGLSEILNKPLILDEFIGTNSTSNTILKGSVVYINGSSGTNPSIDLANANGYENSNVAGVVNEDIISGGLGLIKSKGFINVDLSGFSLGDRLYLSETNGSFTNTRPTSNGIQIGYVISNTTNGLLFVSIKHLLPNIIVSTLDPSGTPNNGDLWLKVAN